MPVASSATFCVLGAGSWGTALAVLLAKNGHRVMLWGRNTDLIESLRVLRCNERYLPGVPLPPLLTVANDLPAALSGAGTILVVVPSGSFRSVLEAIKPFFPPGARLAWATKGLEQGSNKLLHLVVAEVLGDQCPAAVISGPTFAMEMAKGLPTAVTVASTFPGYAHQMAVWLHNKTFRAYTSNDVAGVELGGAVKNVLAIAAGIADGLGFGANTRAALVTRGLVEMIRLGVTLGGRQNTFMGLAGLGDLVLTCTDDASRNRRLGLALGQGRTLEQGLVAIDQVVEGVQTAREIYELALSLGVEMPIVEQVYSVLYKNVAPQDAVIALLEREQRAE